MDENPVDHPGVPEEQYHTLGPKTLWIFVLERIHLSMVLLLLALGLLVLRSTSFLATTPLGNLSGYANLATVLAFVLFVVVFGLTFLYSWLIYSHFKFCLGDNALKIKRGIIEKEEIAIPYRQIQDVDINRDLGFQMMGLSRIVILTAGHDDDKPGDNESEGILPALDKDLAEWLQTQLLNRSNIQKVVETK